MSAPTPEVSGLPNWMLIFAFVASLILTILKILEGIFSAFRKSKLEVVLTREVFFRIFETGEAIYANVVLVAYDIGALIKSIKATLKKEDGPTKEFELNVAQIGEKYRIADGSYQFSFHSSSPLAFIPANNPQRQVYICEHASYAEATKQEFKKFQQQIIKIKEKYTDVTEEKEVAKLFSDLDQFNNSFCASIMDKIQLEKGKYSLSITITYRQMAKYLPRFITRKAESKIQFVVEDFARDLLRYSLNNYLQKKSYQIITDKAELIAAPEYAPSNIVES
jgi:hypothetical protein